MMTEEQMAKLTKESTVKAIKTIFVGVGVKFSVRHYGINGQTIH